MSPGRYHASAPGKTTVPGGSDPHFRPPGGLRFPAAERPTSGLGALGCRAAPLALLPPAGVLGGADRGQERCARGRFGALSHGCQRWRPAGSRIPRPRPFGFVAGAVLTLTAPPPPARDLPGLSRTRLHQVPGSRDLPRPATPPPHLRGPRLRPAC